MFFGMVEVLQRLSPICATSPEEARRLNNAMIEAIAIHLRNLIDFLYPINPKYTDVVAADFCAAGAWDKERPPITRGLKDARKRANREIAHLTRLRITGNPPEKDWDFESLASEIRPLLQLVVSKAEKTRLAPQVAAAIR